MPRLFLTLLLASAATFSAWTAAAADEREPRRTEPRAGEVVNFSLLDYKGKYYELRRSEARVVVLFFTSFNCPLARQSIPKIRALRSQFTTNGVVFWLVNASTQEDPDDAMVEMLVRSRNSGAARDPAFADPDFLRLEVVKSAVGSLPVLRDEKQLLARRLGVTSTCETVAIDTKSLSILFRGAIDDQFSDSAKTKPDEKYLGPALSEFLAGKPVTTPRAPVYGTPIRFGIPPAAESVSYHDRIAPLLQQHCVGCHSAGNIGPFSMSSYQKVKGWSAMIEEVVLERRMPPWHADPHYGKFANSRGLTSSESHALLHWIQQGCPRGEGDDPLTNAAPPAIVWKLGEPDFIAALPKTQEIPATGTLNYRYLDSDFEMPRDAWLRGTVCRPGNAKVVHHIIVRVRYPAGYKDAPPEAYLFTSWVPGLAQGEFPSGTGMFLPKGARFNFEMHYTTTGQAQTDRSEMGLYLAQEPAKRRLEVRASDMRDFELVPGDPDARHFSHYCFKRDALLYDLSPHMHLRGSWFKFQLLYPDGRRETLLSVPNYDFNWQTSYRLATPKPIPAGTWMFCTGGHDNSAKNPNNPDPTKRVRWGLQSWDEMFMGFMTVADAPPGTAAK